MINDFLEENKNNICCIWFYDKNCGACNAISPYIDELILFHENNVTFLKTELNDENKEFYLNNTDFFQPEVVYVLDENNIVVFDENNEPKTKKVLNDDGTAKMVQTIIVPNFMLFNNKKLVGNFPGVDLNKVSEILNLMSMVKNEKI